MNNLPYQKLGVAFLIGFLVILGVGPTWAGPSPEIPVKGMATLVDVGAGACIPCKMMAPILEKLEKAIRARRPLCLSMSGKIRPGPSPSRSG